MAEVEEYTNFIEEKIDADLAAGVHSAVQTRFPPEPNGFLHIGHAKSICLNFGLALKYGGKCNLRFDDTNPTTEDVTYVESIKKDIEWLGFKWDGLYHSSDYFDQLYAYAEELIEKGLAYVCELSKDQWAEYRGVPTEPGKNSPFRDRSPAENMDLFRRMKAGEFEEGSMILRAKVDMSSSNLHMRDPAIYRIKKAHHYRTGNKWNVYPMYDFAHCLSDAQEHITHSLCTLEFEVHRPIYDWLVENVSTPSTPRQTEFARLYFGYTVTSKRKLLTLVNDGHVTGWDDPRMPTISGMRRRGIPPEAIREFCDGIGVARRDGITDPALLDFHTRQHLNKVASRYMGVLDPLKVVITNYPEGQEEWLDAINNPEDETAGTRQVPFSRELYIEKADFMIDPPKKFFRLGVGREVRLRYGYYITCQEAIQDENGNVVELRCTYDPETKGGQSADGRKVKGTLHWVSVKHAVDSKVRLYDRLFTEEEPDGHEDKDFTTFINPDSVKEVTAKLEPALTEIEPGTQVQFERMGYFVPDVADSTDQTKVWNRVVTLRDTWAKMVAKGKA